MKNDSEKEWLNDFQDFVKSEGIPVPEGLAKKIISQVHANLNPSAWLVFVKLFGIHLVVGTLNMGICDQFGMSPFQTGFSLSDYFMKFGHSFCMFCCGIIFIGLSVAIGRVLLREEEITVFRRSAPLQVFGLSTFSLGIFAAFGAEIALGIGILWFIGSMLAGVGLALIPQRRHSRLMNA